jgi:hypothetical protein
MNDNKQPSKFSDILTTATDKEIDAIALMNMVEDNLWLKGEKILINGVEKDLGTDSENSTVEEEAARWKSYFDTATTENAWKDGKHWGDCTKVPMTCFRCLCEEQLRKARKFILYINGTEYNSY